MPESAWKMPRAYRLQRSRKESKRTRRGQAGKKRKLRKCYRINTLTEIYFPGSVELGDCVHSELQENTQFCKIGGMEEESTADEIAKWVSRRR
jgi:hypothetical protein